MILHALRVCNLNERQRILEILRKPRKKTTSVDILNVKEILGKYNSINYANNKSIEFSEKAKKSIKDVPGNLRNFLEEFADFVVQRQI